MTNDPRLSTLAVVAQLDQALATNAALARTVAAQDTRIAELVIEQQALREIANAAVAAHIHEVDHRTRLQAERDHLEARLLRAEQRPRERRFWWWV